MTNLYCPICGYVEAVVKGQEFLRLCKLCIQLDPNPVALVEWQYICRPRFVYKIERWITPGEPRRFCIIGYLVAEERPDSLVVIGTDNHAVVFKKSDPNMWHSYDEALAVIKEAKEQGY